MSKNTAVAEKNNTAVSTDVLDFAADAGAGMENVDQDSLAIPFVTILQGLSPQIETVDGAKPGLFINTITNELSSSVNVIPVAFQRRYLQWAPRSKGGGFKGMHDVASIETNPAYVRNEEGKLLTPEGDELKDTRIHYVLTVGADGSYSAAIVSMSSTQIKKSKRWLSRIQGVQLKDKNGRVFNPPSFSHIYKLTSVKETNDSGSWYGYDVGMVGQVQDAELYKAAKALHEQVQKGEVQASVPPEHTEEASDKF